MNSKYNIKNIRSILNILKVYTINKNNAHSIMVSILDNLNSKGIVTKDRYTIADGVKARIVDDNKEYDIFVIMKDNK